MSHQFRITFVNPANLREHKSFSGQCADIDSAMRVARDAFFDDTPLRAATWVIQSVENRDLTPI
jgi:hypothetical protein